MSNPNPMFVPKAFSLAHARSSFAGTDPKRLALLIKNMPFDYGYIEDDFTGALVTADWTTALTAGGGPTAFAFSAVRGGVVQGNPGATLDDATAIHRAQTFLDPADNPFMLIVWNIATVTNLQFEIGMSDPKADEALPGVTDVDTPAIGNGATDLVAIHMDTGSTLTTAELVGDGTTGAAAVSAGPSLATAAYTPTGGTNQTMLIGVRANLGYAHIWDGDKFVGSYSVGNGPDSGVLIRPYAMFRTRNTTTKQVQIDYIGFGWERNN